MLFCADDIILVSKEFVCVSRWRMDNLAQPLFFAVSQLLVLTLASQFVCINLLIHGWRCTLVHSFNACFFFFLICKNSLIFMPSENQFQRDVNQCGRKTHWAEWKIAGHKRAKERLQKRESENVEINWIQSERPTSVTRRVPLTALKYHFFDAVRYLWWVSFEHLFDDIKYTRILGW